MTPTGLTLLKKISRTGQETEHSGALVKALIEDERCTGSCEAERCPKFAASSVLVQEPIEATSAETVLMLDATVEGGAVAEDVRGRPPRSDCEDRVRGRLFTDWGMLHYRQSEPLD